MPCRARTRKATRSSVERSAQCRSSTTSTSGCCWPRRVSTPSTSSNSWRRAAAAGGRRVLGQLGQQLRQFPARGSQQPVEVVGGRRPDVGAQRLHERDQRQALPAELDAPADEDAEVGARPFGERGLEQPALPTPASPPTSRTTERPSAVRDTAERSAASSCSRPTRTGLTTSTGTARMLARRTPLRCLRTPPARAGDPGRSPGPGSEVAGRRGTGPSPDPAPAASATRSSDAGAADDGVPRGRPDERHPRQDLQGHRDRGPDRAGGAVVTAAPGTMRSALRHGAFRRLVAGLAISQAGDWLYNVALLAFVYERTHSATWLAVTTAARVAPIVVFGPLGGVLADRFDRRRVMVASDLVRVVLMLGLATVALTGLPVVLAPVLAALATAAAAPYPACTAATTPRLVPDADLPGATRRDRRSAWARWRRPVVGAALLFLGSPATAFLVNAGTFALSALAVLSIPAGAAFRPGRTGANGRACSPTSSSGPGRCARTRSPSVCWGRTWSAASSTACRRSCSRC